MPGSVEVRRATHAALSSGAPSCGQRLSSAKNSPLTWNTTMSRPSTSTTLLPPGGISVVRATMCRAMESKLVQRAGVAVEDLEAFGFAQRRLEGKARIVEIPMRIVRGEQQAIDADPFDQRSQMPRLVRLVDRLGSEPEALAHIFRRTPLEVRDLLAEALEMLVHSPHGRGDPAEAAFDEYDLQAREALGHAFDHQACELGRHRMRIRLMLLGVVGRPAAAGRRVAAIAADMDAERQVELLRARVDRPVTAAPQRLVGPRTDIDLHILADFRATRDLGNGRLGVVLPDQNRGLQPGLPAGPVRELPFVDGALDRGAEFEVLLREDEHVEHLQDAELDVERIEVLLAHEGEIGSGRAAGRRPGIAARDQGPGPRIGRGADIGRAQMIAVGLQVLLPALRQERVEVGARMQARMHVAVDDPQAALGGGSLVKHGAVDDVAHAILLLKVMRRERAAERFQADCRHTCAIRYLPADAAVSRRRRQTASADNRTRTGTSCPNRSC